MFNLPATGTVLRAWSPWEIKHLTTSPLLDVTDNTSRAQQLTQALRRVHRGVLATIVVCALVIASAADPADDAGLGGADRRFTLAALALGIGSILARRQGEAIGLEPRTRLWLALAGMLLAGAIAVVGVALALTQDEREAALLYALAAAILALRRPAPIIATHQGDPT